MAALFDPRGLLDLSKAKPEQQAKLPKGLAPDKATQKEPEKSQSELQLFAEEPSLADLKALTKASPVDPHLYNSFASLLNGLSSGPGEVMKMFRALTDDEIVVRLFLPQRPHPTRLPQPLYFRVKTEHAALAIQRKWVGPKAPLWLALFAAVYYSYIKERDTYYDRKDLGGAANAAWLLLFGKDSSRAEYEEEGGAVAGGAAGAGARGGSGDGGESGGATLPPQETLSKVLGVPGGKVDSEFCARYVFDEPKGTGRLTKEWLFWVSKQKIQPSTGLRRGLTKESLAERRELRKWLKAQPGLSAEVISRLLLFLEANGVFTAIEKERYREGVKKVWERVRTAVEQRLPIAVELHQKDPDRSILTGDKSTIAEVAAIGQLAVPMQKGEARALRYVLLRPVNGGASAGRKFAWKQDKGVHVLTTLPSKQPVYWMELDVFMSRGVQLLGGAAAAAALAQRNGQTSFSFSFSFDLAELAKKAP